jgi:hypothetical protein
MGRCPFFSLILLKQGGSTANFTIAAAASEVNVRRGGKDTKDEEAPVSSVSFVL